MFFTIFWSTHNKQELEKLHRAKYLAIYISGNFFVVSAQAQLNQVTELTWIFDCCIYVTDNSRNPRDSLQSSGLRGWEGLWDRSAVGGGKTVRIPETTYTGSLQESLAIPGTQGMSQRDLGIVMANLDITCVLGFVGFPFSQCTRLCWLCFQPVCYRLHWLHLQPLW